MCVCQKTFEKLKQTLFDIYSERLHFHNYVFYNYFQDAHSDSADGKKLLPLIIMP